MALIIEEKEEYVDIINFIWSGTMQNNTDDNITEDSASWTDDGKNLLHQEAIAT